MAIGRNVAITLLEPVAKDNPSEATTWTESSAGGVVDSISDDERYGGEFKFSDEALAVTLRRNAATASITSEWSMRIRSREYRVLRIEEVDAYTLRVTIAREAGA